MPGTVWPLRMTDFKANLGEINLDPFSVMLMTYSDDITIWEDHGIGFIEWDAD